MADFNNEKAQVKGIPDANDSDAALFTHKVEPYDSADPDADKSEEERAQLVSSLLVILKRHLIYDTGQEAGPQDR